MENGPFIDGLPMKNMVIFHGYVRLPEGVCIYIYIIHIGWHTMLDHSNPPHVSESKAGNPQQEIPKRGRRETSSAS